MSAMMAPKIPCPGRVPKSTMLTQEPAQKLNLETYRRKVMGCWLGKAVGGTLGGPFEGNPLPDHDLTFYEPVPDEMLPNDDLDLQIVWLQAIQNYGLPVDRHLLAEAWIDGVHLWPGEYGVCMRNQVYGLKPPLTGSFDNPRFKDGMGAAIRTELWACLAPGNPELAAKLVMEDACCDHEGDGIHAPVFLASVQSAAFVESDVNRLIEIGLRAIPEDCAVADAIRIVLHEWPRTRDRRHVLAKVLEKHDSLDFTYNPMNLGIIILGWISGGGQFGKSICDAVNCGKDTDCTGATLGALLGILAPESIGDRWLQPIGRDMVLSPGMCGMTPAPTLDQLTDEVVDLSPQVLAYYGAEPVVSDLPRPTRIVPHRIPAAIGSRISLERAVKPQTSLIETAPIAITVTYPRDVRLAPGEPGAFAVEWVNATSEPRPLRADVRAPRGWTLKGTDRVEIESLGPGEAVSVAFELTPSEQTWRPYRSFLEVKTDCGGGVVRHRAGLLMSIPFATWSIEGETGEDEPKRPDDARRHESREHEFRLESFGLADRTAVFELCLKNPWEATPRFMAQSSRPARIWLDGRKILDHEGGWTFNAIHIARETGADAQISRGVHRLVIAVGPGWDDDAGHLFWAIGFGDSWRWHETVEFRDPFLPSVGGPSTADGARLACPTF